MKLNVSKEWLEAHRAEDDGADFSAGDLMMQAHEEVAKMPFQPKSPEPVPFLGELNIDEGIEKKS